MTQLKEYPMRLSLIIIYLLLSYWLYGQNYTSYFTGNSNDLVVVPQGGVCLMGGATENDNAMRWFLERANGGDILILRASGSDGYNDYLYSELGMTVNSVETIVFNDATAAEESYIHSRIEQAEAIWFAGGDQWNYVSFWRNSAIDSLINAAISNRKIVVGGTSAGMAVLGGYYFSAQNGTVTSQSALFNPYHPNMTVDSSSFLKTNYLQDVITDTHYDNPDRKGRHVAFLARILTDYGEEAKGIACEEYTAVCIDTGGKAYVFGSYPDYDDTAFFIQTNCALENRIPENCSPGDRLDWNLNGLALKVYQVKGTNTGSNWLDLNDWSTGSGGAWQDWSVNDGVFNETNGAIVDCIAASNENLSADNTISIYPNPAQASLIIQSEQALINYRLFDAQGKLISSKNLQGQLQNEISLYDVSAGYYFLYIYTKAGFNSYSFIKK